MADIETGGIELEALAALRIPFAVRRLQGNQIVCECGTEEAAERVRDEMQAEYPWDYDVIPMDPETWEPLEEKQLTDVDWQIWHDIHTRRVMDVFMRLGEAGQLLVDLVADAIRPTVDAFVEMVGETWADLNAAWSSLWATPRHRGTKAQSRAAAKAARNRMEYSQPWPTAVMGKRRRKGWR